MQIAIRAASSADIPAMVGLLEQLYALEQDFDFDAERQRRGLQMLLKDTDRARIWVAVHEDGVVGMVSCQTVVSTAEGGLSGWVEDLVVDAACRGRGIGRMLLAAVERWAGEQGLPRLQLLADLDNTPALEFYRRMGWTRTRLGTLRRRPGSLP